MASLTTFGIRGATVSVTGLATGLAKGLARTGLTTIDFACVILTVAGLADMCVFLAVLAPGIAMSPSLSDIPISELSCSWPRSLVLLT
ncbi:hypothetical protein EI94DRAFT_1732267 [Lactarius quietus]|nr:hypothetical protein EI94DRAFT_1732267 [Lactarius quietus]